MNVKEFVLDYLQREYTIPDDVDIMNLNYKEAGYIDSLGFLQFMATIEDEFDIVFSDEEYTSQDIYVVGKLVELIEEKLKK